jgi:hypothetical protein
LFAAARRRYFPRAFQSPTGPLPSLSGVGWISRFRAALDTGIANVPEMDDSNRKISEHLVRLVQVLFGVVAGQSLLLYRHVITSPFHHWSVAAAIALFSIYMMIVWSWIDWTATMETRPYDFRPHRGIPRGGLVCQTERFRFYTDIAIVSVYAYILFQVEPLVKDPGADIRYLLLGYPLVFALYLASGILRMLRHGQRASKPRFILFWGAVYLGLFFAYRSLRPRVDEFDLNIAALCASLLIMYAFRTFRRRAAHRAAQAQQQQQPPPSAPTPVPAS